MNNDKALKYLYNNYEAGFNFGYDKGFERGKEHANNLIDLGLIHTL